MRFETINVHSLKFLDQEDMEITGALETLISVTATNTAEILLYLHPIVVRTIKMRSKNKSYELIAGVSSYLLARSLLDKKIPVLVVESESELDRWKACDQLLTRPLCDQTNSQMVRRWDIWIDQDCSLVEDLGELMESRSVQAALMDISVTTVRSCRHKNNLPKGQLEFDFGNEGKRLKSRLKKTDKVAKSKVLDQLVSKITMIKQKQIKGSRDAEIWMRMYQILDELIDPYQNEVG
jgi:hypothetical protein